MTASLARGLLKLRLADRFVLVTLALLLLVQLAGFWAAHSVVREQVRQEVQQKLTVASRIWEQLLIQNDERLSEASAVLASDFGFRTAVATADEATIGSALLNSSQRIGASVAFLLTPRNRLTSASRPITPDLQSQFERISQDLSAGSESEPERAVPQLSIFNGQPTQFVKVPIKAPRLIGYVLMGFPVEQSLLDRLRRLSETDAVLWTREFQASGPQRLGTLGLDDPGRLVPVDGRVQYQGHTYLVTHEPIRSNSGEIDLYLLGSLDLAQASFQRLQMAVLAITLAGLAVFAFGVRWTSRKITRPLEQLTEATAHLGQGDFDIEVKGTRRADEIGVLAKSFDRMRQDIQAQRNKILHLAYYDPLTELPNRLKFIEWIHQNLGDQPSVSSSVVVLTINLDRFKQVNDVLGYSVGDRLLRATADRISVLIDQPGNLLARISGDEFAVVLTRTDLESARQMARRVQHALSEPLELDGTQIDLSASIGLARMPEDAQDPESLLNASQLAMYAAKVRSEDIVEFDPSMDTATPENLSLLTELRRAVKNAELRLFLQPKVETSSGRVIAAEALIRWQHPDNGMIAPYKFVPFAEQTGFVRELTRWMVEQVAAVWAELQPDGAMFRISVNLSTRDLLDPKLPEFLESVIEKYSVEPTALCLEITESAIMDDPRLAEETLNRLSNRGFRLSIDDFGTGYSSLGYLKRLPVNELKIDQSFVFGMMDNQNDAVIVRSTVDLAHNLGLDVVAEGVETQAMYDALQALGCEEVQGYLIGRPMPVDEFKRWRTEWEAAHPVQQDD